MFLNELILGDNEPVWMNYFMASELIYKLTIKCRIDNEDMKTDIQVLFKEKNIKI
jgi:hypothetical protein